MYNLVQVSSVLLAQQLAYICGSTIILVDGALQGKHEVMTGDHNTVANSLFERLHIWLDAREVQSLWGKKWEIYFNSI